MSLKISHSAVQTYSTCSKKYDLHYNKRLRSHVISGALLFGSAYDKALITLRETKDLEAAKKEFVKIWSVQEINGETTRLSDTTKVVYSQKDYDSDLIFEVDEAAFKQHFPKEEKSLKQLTAFYRELKKEKGHAGLTDEQKRVYNYGHWICLLNKGLILLDGYHKHILPRIKKVLSHQKKISIKNEEGDEIIGYIDLIAELDDGKTYILDDKTSGSEYEKDAAATSQQLIVYYYNEKEAYKLDGVGFLVSYKQLNKNKKKVCQKCGFDGSGGRHKTCPQDTIKDGLVGTASNGTEVRITKETIERCNGEWVETISPEARFDVILNEVTEAAENLVLETFDLAANGIKKGVFVPNLNACEAYGKDFRCQFYSRCWKGKDDDLIVVPERKR
jgi:hypothetical protein